MPEERKRHREEHKVKEGRSGVSGGLLGSRKEDGEDVDYHKKEEKEIRGRKKGREREREPIH